jgi:hypothetical protein
MKFKQNNLITNQAMNTNMVSPPEPLVTVYAYAVQAYYTGTPTGTFKLQASCDPISINSNANSPVNWTDIINSNYAVAASGNYMWNVVDCAYNWVRLVYTDTSGGASTAVLNVNINTKGV